MGMSNVRLKELEVVMTCCPMREEFYKLFVMLTRLNIDNLHFRIMLERLSTFYPNRTWFSELNNIRRAYEAELEKVKDQERFDNVIIRNSFDKKWNADTYETECRKDSENDRLLDKYQKEGIMSFCNEIDYILIFMWYQPFYFDEKKMVRKWGVNNLKKYLDDHTVQIHGKRLKHITKVVSSRVIAEYNKIISQDRGKKAGIHCKNAKEKEKIQERIKIIRKPFLFVLSYSRLDVGKRLLRSQEKYRVNLIGSANEGRKKYSSELLVWRCIREEIKPMKNYLRRDKDETYLANALIYHICKWRKEHHVCHKMVVNMKRSNVSWKMQEITQKYGNEKMIKILQND